MRRFSCMIVLLGVILSLFCKVEEIVCNEGYVKANSGSCMALDGGFEDTEGIDAQDADAAGLDADANGDDAEAGQDADNGSDNDADGGTDGGADPCQGCQTDEICIPAGKFRMGKEGGGALDNEGPLHTVYLSSFCIDKYEVTNAAFNSSGFGSLSYDESRSNYPVINVTYDQAFSYCDSKGKILPTEAQWEKSARGGCELGTNPNECDDSDKRDYPWGGTTPSCERANYRECTEYGDTLEVTSFENGVSPYGVYNMLGNVSEWVKDNYEQLYYKQCDNQDCKDTSCNEEEICVNPTGPGESIWGVVVRGGSFNTIKIQLRISARMFKQKNSNENDLGFRCVRNF